jgi:hypothetical protein
VTCRRAEGLRNRGSIPGRVKQLWRTSSLLSNGHRGVKLTSDLHLVPRLGTVELYLPLLHAAVTVRGVPRSTRNISSSRFQLIFLRVKTEARGREFAAGQVSTVQRRRTVITDQSSPPEALQSPDRTVERDQAVASTWTRGGQPILAGDRTCCHPNRRMARLATTGGGSHKICQQTYVSTVRNHFSCFPSNVQGR